MITSLTITDHDRSTRIEFLNISISILEVDLYLDAVCTLYFPSSSIAQAIPILPLLMPFGSGNSSHETPNRQIQIYYAKKKRTKFAPRSLDPHCTAFLE